jgi:DNA-binding beta-propeller fold protein YncE
MARLFRLALIACVVALLTACGGGGGGPSGGSPPATPPGGGGNPPPPPPPPPALQPVKLGPQTYQFSVRAAGTLIDTSLSFGTISSIAFAARVTEGGTTPLQQSCPDAGTVALELVDSDRDGDVSVGDRVVLRFVDCTVESTVTNGVVNVDVQSMSSTPSAAVAALRVTIASYEVRESTRSGSLSGGLDVLWTTTATTDRFLISGTRVASAGAFGDHVLENFQLDLLQDYTTYEYQLTVRGNVASQSVGGTFTFETESTLVGILGRYPEAGVLTLRGDQSAVRLEEGAFGEQSPSEVGISADFDGDGIFVPAQVSLLWLEAFDLGLLDSFRPGVTVPPDTPSIRTLKGRTVELALPFTNSLADIIVDPSRERLYASVPASNEVVAVSTSTYHVVDRIGVGSRPLGLHLPADHSALFVALNRGGAIARLDLDTRQVTRINTAAAINTSAPESIAGNAQYLYVAGASARDTSGPGSIVAPSYYARVARSSETVERLSETFTDQFRSGVAMVLSPDGRYLYATEAVVPSASDTRLVKRDLSLPGAPVVMSRLFTFPPALTGMALSPDGATLVLNSGEVLRASDFGLLATLQSNNQAVVFTPDGSRIVALRFSDLIVYDGDSFVTARTFHPDCPISGLAKRLAYIASHDELVITSDNTICALSMRDRLNPPGQPGSPAPPPPLTPQPLPVTVENVFAPLNQNGSAAILAGEIDRPRGHIYLGGMSNFVAGVAVLSLEDLSTITTITLPTNIQPFGLSLDAAGQRLYVNQDGDQSSIPVIDTSTRTVLPSLSYPANLFGDAAYGLGDVQWIGNGKLLFTGRSNGEPVRIATMNVDTGVATPIAGGAERFAAGRKLLIAPDQKSAFLNGGLFNVGLRLERIDLTLPDPNVDLARTNDELDGATLGTTSADGKLLYFSGGIVVDPQTLMLAGQTAEGLQLPTPDGSTVYALDTTRRLLSVFDARTYQLRAVYSIQGCGQNLAAFARLGSDSRDIIWAQDARICRVTVPE